MEDFKKEDEEWKSVIVRINDSIEQYKQINNEIDEKDKIMHEETRIAVVEDLKNEIASLTIRRDNLKEMIEDSIREVKNNIQRLSTMINNLFLDKSKHSENFTKQKQKLLDGAIAKRTELEDAIVKWNKDGFLDRTDTLSNSTATNSENAVEKVDNYTEKLKRFSEKLNDMINTMIMNTDLFTDRSEEINSILDEFAEIKKEGNELLEKIKNDKSINPTLITEKLKEIRDTIVRLKSRQIENYNAAVRLVNKRLELIKSWENVPDDIRDVSNMSEINTKIRQYDQKNYFSELKYDELTKLYNLTSKYITKEENTVRGTGDAPSGTATVTTTTDEELDTYEKLSARLDLIEGRLDKVREVSSKETLTAEEVKECLESLNEISELSNETYAACDKLKDCLDSSKYDELITRIKNVQTEVDDINRQISEKYALADDNLLDRINALGNSVKSFHDHVVVPSLCAKQSKQFIESIGMRSKDFRAKLDTLKSEAIARHSAGKINDDEYKNIEKAIRNVENTITEIDTKTLAYEVINEKGFFDLIGHGVGSVENALNRLETLIDEKSVNGPIKRKDRKVFDQLFKSIEKEISRIERNLEDIKEEDKDKYNAEMERLNSCKNKLAELNKKYRKKCPLHVRAIKSAKYFLKKHKKVCLIAAGLAAISLLHATVGPVIIPAIMHGNLLIANKSVALRPLMLGINKILGGSINAKITSAVLDGSAVNVWELANGNIISPSCATASLLKGIAISGIGSAALITPAVIGIKSLIGKIKKKENKKEKHTIKDKLKNVKSKLKRNSESAPVEWLDGEALDDVDEKLERGRL